MTPGETRGVYQDAYHYALALRGSGREESAFDKHHYNVCNLMAHYIEMFEGLERACRELGIEYDECKGIDKIQEFGAKYVRIIAQCAYSEGCDAYSGMTLEEKKREDAECNYTRDS